MDILLSAILGELTTRSINFFISNVSKPTILDVEDNLQRALLRARVIADEAMGRHVTNHAILLQLDMLREAIHRGYYTLDTFRYQSHHEDDVKNPALSNSFSLSKKSSRKNFCSSSSKTQIFEQMEKSLDYLSSMIIDVKELVVFLMSYPPMYRQPYSMHILLGNCMFGRQMEAELIINFLLQAQPHEDLEVLPIIGRGKVGKSTLVAHVCKDERVHDHFSEVFFLHDYDFKDIELDLVTFIEACALKHQNWPLQSNKDRRLLYVVELVGDLSEDAWNMLYSASKRCLPRGSKIIITSRSDKIKKFGTTGAVTLKYLSQEAHWYFFKTLTFGSTDPETHPRLANLAMEMSRLLNRSFLSATVAAYLLRENFETRYWNKYLAFLRGLIQKYVFRFGEHPFDLVDQNRTAHYRRRAAPSQYVVVYHQCQPTFSSQEEVPKITCNDLLFGSLKCSGKLKFLAWKSRLPPYYSYVYTCEIQERKYVAAKRKRSVENGATIC